MRGIPRIAAHLHSKIKDCDQTADIVANPSSVCRWNPDMYGVNNTFAGQAYYNSLLELYASWGVDFIKCDDICNTNNNSRFHEGEYAAQHEVEMIANAIQQCNRPIVLSLSPGPALIEKAWHYEKYANMWRITDDFWDNWDLLKNMFARCELWQNHVSKGCYPDCDMLPLGMIGKGFNDERHTCFTKEEQKTMMTLWCIFGSPLMLGADMPQLDEWTISLLTNIDVLKLLDPDCHGCQIFRDDTKAIWKSENKNNNTVYIALFNLSDKEQTIRASLDELELCCTDGKELWTRNCMTIEEHAVIACLSAHACALYQVF